MLSSKTIHIFLELLRSELLSIPYDKKVELDTMAELIPLAKIQDVLGLIVDGLKKSGNVVSSELEKDYLLYIYQYNKRDYVRRKTQEVLSLARIPFIPLKGLIIKDYYRKPWLRNSCDLDILVKEGDINNAIDALIDSGYKTDKKRNYHDVSLLYDGIHLELHFSICENIPQIDALLKKVWEYSIHIDQYEYRELPEFFVFHHMAHMFYHFIKGGCGIKPFIDLWILQNMHFYNEEKLKVLLNQCDILNFYVTVCHVIDVWFNKKPSDDISKKIEKYIIAGGAFGNRKNAEITKIILNKGNTRYLWHGLFVSPQTIRALYPEMNTNFIFLPIYYCRRIIDRIFGSKRKRTREKIKNAFKYDIEEKEEIKTILTEMGVIKEKI